jgi:glucokinase
MRNTNVPNLVGINIGGTSTTIVSGSSAGTIDARIATPTDRTQRAEAAYAVMRAAIADLHTVPDAIGVAVGGPLDADAGIVLSAPHLPHLAGFPLAERLRADFGVPVAVHHDAAACALAEYRWSADHGVRGLAYLTCGTGFGVGLVLDGRLRYGSGGRAPEIGHVRFRADGPDIFEKPGCYEGYGSANAIGLLARFHAPQTFAHATPTDVIAAAERGDHDAIAALDDNVAAVGSACALLVDLLALDVIVLGSLATYLGAPWITRVRTAMDREALPGYASRVTLRAPIDAVQDRSALAAALDALGEMA